MSSERDKERAPNTPSMTDTSFLDEVDKKRTENLEEISIEELYKENIVLRKALAASHGLMLLARRNEELLEERARLSEELDTLRGALSVAAKQLEELKSAEALSRLQKRSNARHAHAATAATGTVTSSGSDKALKRASSKRGASVSVTSPAAVEAHASASTSSSTSPPTVRDTSRERGTPSRPSKGAKDDALTASAPDVTRRSASFDVPAASLSAPRLETVSDASPRGSTAGDEDSSSDEESYSDSELKKVKASGAEKKKLKGKLAFDMELTRDIIYLVKKALSRAMAEFDAEEREAGGEEVALEASDYAYSYQVLDHRKPEQLLKFKDFAPRVFRRIRAMFGVTEWDIINSIVEENVFGVKGEGKSGAFMLITKDHKFILKTATKEERDFMWQLLPYYYQHLRHNPNTLLSRFYGVFSMKHEGVGGVTRFFIMNSVFFSQVYYDPIEKFDLKGSTFGRSVPDDMKGKVSTLKDVDLLNAKRKIYLPEGVLKRLTEQLKRDSEFLANHDVMDYSLLVGIHYETEENKDILAKRIQEQAHAPKSTMRCTEFQAHDGCLIGHNPTADNRREYYLIGMIDILVQYSARKKLENFFRGTIGGAKDTLSVVHPKFYSSRFIEFMTTKLLDKDPTVQEEEGTKRTIKKKKTKSGKKDK